MQANTANEHSQMLAQVPANACSDSESRKCSLVLLLVPYITLAYYSPVFHLLKLASKGLSKTRREPSPRALDQR